MTTQSQISDHNLHDRDLIGRMAAWFRDCFHRLAEEREWQGLDRPERGRIAQDLGMGSADLGAVIASSGGSAELDELLARTGLRNTAAMRGGLHDMQRLCGQCHARSDCRDWLSVPAEARDDAVLPYFCPNRGELNMLREMQTGCCAHK